MDRFNRIAGLSNKQTPKVPVPAARTNLQDPISSGLLISVIKTLTSTVSDDQRQLERSRLEKGYEDSGLVIDHLLKEHHSDVSDCLNSFRKVSNGITNCRERIHNVKNALHTCKSLLQCRRDDLKKLWMESAEQRYMNNILQQIHEMKHMDQTIEQFVRDAKYREAVDALKRADILLNGPLSQIDGLNQLRTNVTETSQTLFEKIVQDLVHSVVVVPFDIQNLELMKSIGDSSINESVVCVTIIARYASGGKNSKSGSSSTLPSYLLPIIASYHQRGDWTGVSSSNYGAMGKSNTIMNAEETPVLLAKINESLDALKVFDQLDSAMENILSKTTTICIKSINDSISLLRLLIKDGVADSSHLAQLIQVVMQQMRGAAYRFTLLTKELQRIKPGASETDSSYLLARFWEAMQTVFETLLSDHLDVNRSTNITFVKSSFSEGSRPGEESHAEGGQDTTHRKTLFSFENTSFSSTSNSSLLKKKQLNLLCPSTPYNITAIFHLLNRFCAEIEKQLQEASGKKFNKDEEQPCRLNTFLHSFVMDNFVERIRLDMEKKTEQALMTGGGASNNPADVWSSLSSIPSHSVKILTSCLRIFELCEQINQFIHNMGSYTQRFSSLWLLIIADYTKSATDMYNQIIRTRSHQGDNLIEYPKISAAWAVDEDINRLLKSLPNWTVISSWSPMNHDTTPMAGAAGAVLNESEQDVRQRTQRESDILIGNLGTQKQIQRVELITDMEHVKSLVCMHESLQWFASKMRMMISSLPAKAKEIIKCRIQIRTQLGPGGTEKLVEQLMSEALEERLKELEKMSDTCLMMLHLEIRVHCFYHLLPLVRNTRSLVVQDEQDREVVEFGRDITQFYQTLSMYMVPSKLKYLFDGLGHLCASIFIHSSQYMNKLLENDRKRVCRNIYSVQKFLSALSNRPETEMSRAQTFFKLVNIETFDQIFALVKESGEHYTHLEFTYLLALAVRSHPVLSSQPGVLESMLGQLRENLSR